MERLKKDSGATLLDVRTQTEVLRGKIDGAIHIPLDKLRFNLAMIPKDKPVYVNCHSGQRSYIACRILSQNGYDCYNLAGGWRLYESVVHEQASEYDCTKCR